MNKMLVLRRSLFVMGLAYDLAVVAFYWFVAYALFSGLGFMFSVLR